MKVTNEDQSFRYKACNRCNKSTSAALKQSFTCNECLSPIAISTPRCTIQVQVEDSTGALTAYIYGKEAELLLSCTAEDLAHSTSDVASTFVSATAKSTLTDRYLLKIHASRQRYQGADVKKFNIHHAQITAAVELPDLQKSNMTPNIVTDEKQNQWSTEEATMPLQLEATNLDEEMKTPPPAVHQIQEPTPTAHASNNSPSCTFEDLTST